MAAPETPDAGPSQNGETTMHRKARAGRAEHSARAMTLAKALRLSCAKVADTALDLSMAAISIRSETLGGDEVPQAVGQDDLLMLLEGPARSRAAAICDLPLVTALIQQQTMGKVLAADAEATRPLTRTDAAICAPFLDSMLAHAARLPEDPAERRRITDLTFGAWMESPRVLGIALEAPEYTAIRITLDIEGGTAQGKLSLILPTGSPSEDMLGRAGSGLDELPEETLGATVQGLPAELRVGLATLCLSLQELGSLAPEALLDLGTPDFGAVALQDIAGQTLGHGALGQLEGKRAVRIGGQAATAEPAAFAAMEPESDNGLAGMAAPGDLLADLPGLPDIPEEAGADPLEGLADLPDMPDLPDLPDMPELPDLPDMSDLPELDAMPDMADLPELNAN